MVYEGWLSRGVGGRRGASLASSAVRRRDAPRAVATHTGGGTTVQKSLSSFPSCIVALNAVFILVHTRLYRATPVQFLIFRKFLCPITAGFCYRSVHRLYKGPSF